jgi:dTDP-4-amino-4,6-dideoxygalactose transaminase
MLGMNSRLDAIQAAMLRVKLRHLDDWTQRRRKNAENYRELFAVFSDYTFPLSLPQSPDRAFHVYNQFTVRVSMRDELQAYLADCGIQTEIYYPSPLHVEPAFSKLGYTNGQFPHAEAACAEVLSLPIGPGLTAEDQRAVVAAVIGRYQQTALKYAG